MRRRRKANSTARMPRKFQKNSAQARRAERAARHHRTSKSFKQCQTHRAHQLRDAKIEEPPRRKRIFYSASVMVNLCGPEIQILDSLTRF